MSISSSYLIKPFIVKQTVFFCLYFCTSTMHHYHHLLLPSLLSEQFAFRPPCLPPPYNRIHTHEVKRERRGYSCVIFFIFISFFFSIRKIHSSPYPLCEHSTINRKTNKKKTTKKSIKKSTCGKTWKPMVYYKIYTCSTPKSMMVHKDDDKAKYMNVRSYFLFWYIIKKRGTIIAIYKK